MIVQKEILIDANMEKVWKIFSGIGEWHKWSGCIINAEWTLGDKWKPESEFLQTVKGFGIIRQFDSKVRLLESEPCKKVTWRGTRKLISGTHTFEFLRMRNKTKVLNFEHFKGPLAPLLFPMFKNNFEHNFEQFLAGLKRESEK